MAVTIRDIAEAAGVGRTAVSLALRGSPGVAEATRLRIVEVATQLGYVEDPLIARIAERRWKTREVITLAILSVDPQIHLQHIINTSRLAFRCEAFRYADYDPRRLRQVLKARGVEALLLDCVVTSQFIERFDFAGFCVVSMNAGLVCMPIHQVRMDVARGLNIAWERAVNQGYERIGFTYFDEPEACDFIDRDGTIRSLQDQGPLKKLAPLLLRTGSSDAQREQIKKWMLRECPDCVISQIPRTYWLMRELNIRMPDECAFISLMPPNSMEAKFAHCGVDATKILDSSIWLLDRLFRENQRGIPDQRMKILIEPTWTPGQTFPG